MAAEKRLEDYYMADDGYAVIAHSPTAVVLRVKDIETGKIGVVKTVQSRRSYDTRHTLSPEELKMNREFLCKEIAFLKECETRIGRGLAEVNILPMLDSGCWHDNGFDKSEDGWPALVYPDCECSLQNLFIHSGEELSCGRNDFYRWAGQIAGALSAVHTPDAEGVTYLHSDVKPVNIVILDGDAYLIDFMTIKAVTVDDTFGWAGTINWMAPELAIPCTVCETGADADGYPMLTPSYRYSGKADVYGLGLVMFWLVSGGKTPKSQIEISRLVSNSGAVPGAEAYWGKTGGADSREKEVLRQAVYEMLCGTDASSGSGSPIVAGAVNPETEVKIWSLTDRTVGLICSMLEVLEENRPDAGTVQEILGDISKELEGLD